MEENASPAGPTDVWIALQQYNLPLWIPPLTLLTGVSEMAFGSTDDFYLVSFCFRDSRDFCKAVNNI